MDTVCEKHTFSGIIIERRNLKTTIPLLSKHLLSKDKIPSIIQLNKSYETFTGKILDTEDTFLRLKQQFSIDVNDLYFSTNYLVILLNQAPTDLQAFPMVNFELTLNAKFFSHTELIFKLTNGCIQFSAYEVIGDIVHLNLTEEQQKYKKTIADTIYFKTGKTVINKTGKIEANFRFYHSEILAGPRKLTTIHKENDVKFFLDLEKVYWCSRLQSERIRILNLIKKNDVVCDPFCGAGPHVVPAIKKGAVALCNDLNPAAIDCLRKTLEINKLSCDCVENMEAKDFLFRIRDMHVNHFIFNLPEFSLDYIKFTECFKGTFWLHVFFFRKNNQSCQEIIKKRTGYAVKDTWLREVRKVSPSKSVFKLEVNSHEFFSFQKN
ncbi:uncharacterized protein VICG_00509 [Vittaforma corneae ATCC 50505]|uniref:SAM-dependent methyltransferase TRM5/TYW2-type domain-containing protein n=1 Tax=Vittaforma corneae (strain ATCC 50505) TaxID=993615 RepID=L2GPH1_VITCO|nr:uncharacterized protein VICG_00509 [Vittaforma corneae ATCC 50505]ELA42410.1 hypothetical protein VICG_00509 [Vittaforma corneae ATCC 50505]